MIGCTTRSIWIVIIFTSIILINNSYCINNTLSSSSLDDDSIVYDCYTLTKDIFAGKDELMGHFIIRYNGNFIVEAFSDENWYFRTIHLSIGKDKPITGPGNNPIPGLFPYPYVNINTIHFEESIYIDDILCGDVVNIAFHAEAIKIDSYGNIIQQETAWAYGNSTFGGSRWGWYSIYNTCCDESYYYYYPNNEYFGYIGDLVWWDDNRDGIFNNNENGISGVIVYLYICSNEDNNEDSYYLEDITDINGNYYFNNLPYGCYKVLIPDWINNNELNADENIFSIITTLSIYTINIDENNFNFIDADFGFDINDCYNNCFNYDDPCIISSSCNNGECIYQYLICDDGINCTDDSCFNGECLFNPMNSLCNDDITCTNDICDINYGGCIHITMNSLCDDNTYCTDDICNPIDGCIHNSLNSLCNDNIECTDDICNPIDGCINTPLNSLCNDNNECTIDSCSIDNNGCLNSFIECNDNIKCTIDTCDPNIGCIHTPNDLLCNNSNYTIDDCNIGYCDLFNGCIFESIDCNDGIDCTIDSCNENGECIHTPINSKCNDDIECTLDSCDSNLGCNNIPLNSLCNDNIDCTDDICNIINGCINNPNNLLCNDNIDCTNDICNEFSGCSNTPENIECNDNIECTIDICDNNNGCLNNPLNSLCNDNNECTNDLCSIDNNGCQNIDIICNDNIDCTLDSCDINNGCIFSSDNSLCNDNNYCTIDICDYELKGCLYETISCDDGISCTIDSCINDIGCIHTPIDNECNDNNSCTIDICNVYEGCIFNQDLNCYNNSSSPSPPPLLDDDDDIDCDILPFNNASDFNLFSLSSIEGYNSDVEGRIASNGNILLNNYSIGLKNTVNGLYSIISSSKIEFYYGSVWYGNVIGDINIFSNSSIIVNGNHYKAKECCEDDYCLACTSKSITPLPINFEEIEADLLELSLYWSSISNTNNIIIEYSYQSIILTCSIDKEFNHFKNIIINENITSIEINCYEKNTIIIEYSSNTTSIKNLGISLNGGILSNNIIHHFTSESLSITGINLQGSLFAPFSNLYFYNGLITGQVFVGNFIGLSEDGYYKTSGQINHSPFEGCVPSLP